MHARGKLVLENFLYLVTYGHYGYLKIKGVAITWSAISRLQIDEIEKIQQRFKEYDFEFKILNWATQISCFTCFPYFLLTALFLHILYEIENLKKNIVKVHIRKFVHESCISLL